LLLNKSGDYSIAVHYGRLEQITKNSVSAPEIVVTDPKLLPHTIVKDTFDVVVNAFGLEGAVNYDYKVGWVDRS
jgi:hypothetical protein